MYLGHIKKESGYDHVPQIVEIYLLNNHARLLKAYIVYHQYLLVIISLKYKQLCKPCIVPQARVPQVWIPQDPNYYITIMNNTMIGKKCIR